MSSTWTWKPSLKGQKPRRVLLTADTVGGVWSFALDLAEGLIANGTEVCLATFGGAASAAQKAEAAAISGLARSKLDWLESTFKLEWMDDPWTDLELSGRWLLAIERSYKPDVVHLNTLCHGALNWSAPVVTTVHSCVSSWWSAVKSEPLPPNWDRYRTEVQRSLKCAYLITAPSRAMLDSVKHNYGLSLVGARVIPNGRHASRFRTDRKQPFILTAGRLWDEGKNVRALIEVAPGLPWPVLLAGQHRNPNGSEAAFLGCTWLGHLTAVDLASWYARAAIYALPARYEPFGLSVLEAALSSCALVLGDIPSLRELWHDAAIFVPPDDPTRLEAALRNLVEDSALRERMAALAVNRARRYSQSRMVTGYLEAYEWARRNGGKRRYACAS